MPQRGRKSGDPPIIVIGPLSTELRRSVRLQRSRFLAFRDVDEFDAWRRRESSKPHALSRALDTLLTRIGCRRGSLPAWHRDLMERIAEHSCAPPLDRLISPEMPRRSFYRRWREVIPLSPARFLCCLRLEHARNLLQDPRHTLEEVARIAGYCSVDRLRRALGKRA